MKITDVRATLLRFDGPAWMDALNVIGERRVVLVEVETDGGLVGLGEADALGAGHLVAAAVEQDVRPLLVGQDPALIERLHDLLMRRLVLRARRGPVMAAIAGVDIAVWDIFGKDVGRPVYQLLGGYRDRVAAYASGGFYAEGKGLDELAAEARGYVDRGFGAMKMKLGRRPHELLFGADRCRTAPRDDLERVRVVREALGPDRALMVDVNTCWDVPTALRLGRQLEELDVAFLEEPISADDVAGSARLAAALDLPIAGYETELSPAGFVDLIERGAIDVAQPDVIRTGGFTACRRIAAVAAARHMPIAPHAFASAVSTVANLHFLASLPNGGLLEYCQYPGPLMDELLIGMPPVDADGTVALPTGPGLGVELNRAVVARFRV